MSGGMNRHTWMNDVKKAGVYEDICLNLYGGAIL